MPSALVIGGSRFMGRRLVLLLAARGFSVTVVNRGLAGDPFGGRVERLTLDRRSPALAAALAGRTFDLAADFAAYTGEDAAGAVQALAGRVGHYVALSSGQVHLVGADAERPGRVPLAEDAPLRAPMAEPREPLHRQEWLYGMGKRMMEEALLGAAGTPGFPATVLRLPMVQGEGDPSRRTESYLWRMLDGGPLLLPDGGDRRLRHVYAGDVARFIVDLAGRGAAFGRVLNVCQDEAPTLGEFLAMLAGRLGASPRLVEVPAGALEAAALPVAEVSPFSTPWMSMLDPRRAEAEFQFRPTPPEEYLPRLVEDFCAHAAAPPEDRGLRERELALAGA